ncbi:hypothetical protein [Catenovulum sediminis]|uniref:Uncharacterized protein n=1 Tax=Catenovulum sediminis TaxID=1740262 RepID=A0ABV1RHL5_9ALTE|nr:hypothetical protein [Catenovulum sediminis]
MENLISALEVNATLLALAMFITFVVLGVIEKSDNRDQLVMARIEYAFFGVSSLIAFLVFWLI